jgi:uncharacterized membrane protein YqaE (UPF0057 family)
MVAVLATIVKIILAIILPPVAVFLEVGEARVLCFFDVSGAGLAHRREKRLPFISPSPRFLFLSLLHPPPHPTPPTLSKGLGTQFWLNLLLTLLFWLPGVVHAIWLILADRGL